MTHHLARIASIVLTIPMLPACASHTVHESLVARQIQIVDAAGQVVVELGVDDDGSSGLFIRDAAGQDRAMLVHDETQTALYLLDEHGTVRVGVAQFAHGGGGVALHGADSRGASILYMSNEKGSLRFIDGEGTVTSQLPREEAP